MRYHRTLYRFSVRLPATRHAAYDWATDYRPTDLPLMGDKGRRKVERIAENTFVLTDRFETPKGIVTKVKLVHLFPRELNWISTHIAGPTRHSMFFYEILPEGRTRSRLRFTGVQVDRVAAPLSSAAAAKRARQLVREDSAGWRQIASAMGRDLR